jgi:hypothetical protein
VETIIVAPKAPGLMKLLNSIKLFQLNSLNTKRALNRTSNSDGINLTLAEGQGWDATRHDEGLGGRGGQRSGRGRESRSDADGRSAGQVQRGADELGQLGEEDGFSHTEIIGAVGAVRCVDGRRNGRLGGSIGGILGRGHGSGAEQVRVGGQGGGFHPFG